MIRVVVLLAVLVLWFLLGPWVLVAALASLLVPRVRAFVRPEHPWRGLGIAVAVVLVLAGLAWVIPDGRLPLPPGAGVLVSPSYVGRPAMAHPIDGVDVPQNPHLAPNGASSMHDDAWATDTYAWPGPLGDKPEVDTAWYGVEECATLAFDTQDRIVALCGDLSGPLLHVIDPESMRSARDPGPARPRRRRGQGAVGGPLRRRLLLPRRRTTARSSPPPTVGCSRSPRPTVTAADLTVDDSCDLADVIPDDDCLIALLPDWAGRIWFVTQDGVGAATAEPASAGRLDLGEEIANSIAADETGGVYVVTTEALVQLAARRGRPPAVDWRTAYDAGTEQKPGQLSAGSGTTPTILPSGLVAITDNAEPRMHVQFYDADTGAQVCEAPVFEDDESATDNSLVVVGDASVVVENNYGYDSPLHHDARPGDDRRLRPCRPRGDGRVHGRLDQSDEIVGPTSVAKVVAGHRPGLRLHHAPQPGGASSAWYLTAIDARTGETGLLGPHRHRHARQQPLLRRDPRARRLGVRRHARRHGARARPGLSPRASGRAAPHHGDTRAADGEHPQQREQRARRRCRHGWRTARRRPAAACGWSRPRSGARRRRRERARGSRGHPRDCP